MLNLYNYNGLMGFRGQVQKGASQGLKKLIHSSKIILVHPDILGFLMLLRVNMEVKTRMREREKGLRPRFLVILRVKLKVIVIQGK